ncbi:MAG: YheC/YheD family protein [Alicyclobacillus sp.]|nr:YheC/YheD family protein [Alicyclobacillus sp.]
MKASLTGELVWYRQHHDILLGVYAPKRVRAVFGVSAARQTVRCSNLSLPWLDRAQLRHALYRHPIKLSLEGNRVSAGPVFAILAGGAGLAFRGIRTDFRDLLRCARTLNEFVYVLPAASVNEQLASWEGCVRVGFRRWIELPCPWPEAIYNRVPLRNLESSLPVSTAKAVLSDLQIPMFNPEYFNKAVLYDILRTAGLGHYVPETLPELTALGLKRMLTHCESVYLKPATGSIGHGIMKVENQGKHFMLAALRDGRCRAFSVSPYSRLWELISRMRVRGRYVIQAAKPLLRWDGRPCDLRVLVQKRDSGWYITGIGVRVAGPQTITTHVPHGGQIIPVDELLERCFAWRADEVRDQLKRMILQCAEAIDAHYGGELGEMSMDIGLDADGNAWFFEANSKPMKFDEPDIRARSLVGVLHCLKTFRDSRRVTENET